MGTFDPGIALNGSSHTEESKAQSGQTLAISNI